MRFSLKFNDKPTLTLKYSKEEWNILKELLENKLKLGLRTTTNGYGRHAKLEYYVERNEELRRYWDSLISDENNKHMNLQLIDSINDPFYTNGQLNIAIFRIIPDEDLRVEIPLLKFLNVKELNDIMLTIKDFLLDIFNLVLDAEVEIKGLDKR